MNPELKEINVPGYEKVYKVEDAETGLVGIISIHNTNMGPALGGTRIYPYHTFDEALEDVLRLSKGMTYKSAVVEAGLGGGKSVIISDKEGKTQEKLKAFGKAVEKLQGKYICAEDVGCTTQDVQVIREETKYVTGLVNENSSGDPSPFTAWGTFRGIQSVCQFLFGKDSLEGKKIAIQGLGAVGKIITDLLYWAGAELIVSDKDTTKAKAIAKKYGAKYVSPDEILYTKCDVLVPCALGGILNKDSIPNLQCRAIAGCANNQLKEDQDASRLLSYGILYAPDFVINAGGLINVRNELRAEGYNPRKARNQVHAIYDKLIDIYQIAKKNCISTHEAAVLLADHRIKYSVGSNEEQLHFHH